MKFMLIVDTDNIHSLVDFINIQDYVIQVEEMNTEDEQLELDFNTSSFAMSQM